MLAVAGSGISSMSEASMPFQPAMDEPSKAWPLAELVFVEMRHRHGDVLLLAAGIGKTEINELDFVVFHHLHHVGDGLCHQILRFSSGAGMQVLCQTVDPLSRGPLRMPSSRAANGSTFIQINISRFECTESVHCRLDAPLCPVMRTTDFAPVRGPA
jgi:hypothetical protein